MTNDTTLASLARREPLLVMHKLMRERLQERSKRVVAAELSFQLRIVSGGYANKRLCIAIEGSNEGSADSMTVDRDDMLAWKKIHRYADRELVLPA